MGAIGSLWSFAVRFKRRFDPTRPKPDDWGATHRRWVTEHAPGKSFADVGGLFMKEGDLAFAAEQAGATDVTLFDAGDADLTSFAEEHKKRGSKIRFVQGDLEDPVSIREVGPHDIVWNTGVIYHTLNPVGQLMHLREITKELLYIGTLTIPEIPGFPQACIFYPHMDEPHRKPFAAGYKWGTRGSMFAVDAPFDDRPMHGYANCWWGITPSALRAMLRTARFEVIEERPRHQSPYVTEFVARPIPMDPSLPPVTYYRQRGEAREGGGERLPFDAWYDELRKNTQP